MLMLPGLDVTMGVLRKLIWRAQSGIHYVIKYRGLVVWLPLPRIM
jgi:hypothetical protein